MTKLVMANLSSEQRKELISSTKASMPEFNYKEVAIEALDFCDGLIEELKSSKISTERLKQLLGFKSEQIKKLQQTR